MSPFSITEQTQGPQRASEAGACIGDGMGSNGVSAFGDDANVARRDSRAVPPRIPGRF